MPLQATSGAASYDAFGGGVAAVPNYIEDFFRTHLYNGDTGGYIFASSGVSIVSGGMMWVKSRGSATNNYIFSPSLTNANYYLNTNTTAAQSNSGVTNNNFEAVDNGGGMRFGGAYSGISSSATGPFTSWTFRKQPKFFDVVTYSGSSSTQNIAHNLGSVPGCIIVKRTSGVEDWFVYHTSLGNTQYIKLNSTSAAASGFAAWNNTSPTSTQFTVLGGRTEVNAAGSDYVAYLFAHNAGGFGLTGADNVISCGSYVGNAAPTAVTLGFEPQWVMIKPSSGVGNWNVFDNMRGMPVTGGTPWLLPNTSGAEETSSGPVCRATATGFIADADTAGDQVTYIYIAIRRGPMKVPTSGTSIYNAIAYTKTNTTPRDITGAGFPPDLAHYKGRSGGANSGIDNNVFFDRLRGTQKLVTNSTGAETAGNQEGTMLQSGIVTSAAGEMNYETGTAILHFFRRAPSFFDEVCYKGTGVTHTETHNLGVAPELIIVKRRASAATSWAVYAAPLTASYVGFLDLNNKFQADNMWNSTAPTSTAFTVGAANAQVNASGSTYVAYLFATCAGVSKVGSYTGTGTTLQVNCGFTSGARFVLIKRTDSTGDWYVWDSARGIVAGNDPYLLLNSTAAEVTSTDYVDTYSAGFEISSTAPAAINANGGTFIFLAIA